MSAQKPLRLWPGVAIVALQWLGRFVVPELVPGAALYGVVGGVVGGLAILMWWLFFSRAPWIDRVGAVVVMAVALVATPSILHESVATGAMGTLFFLLVVPVLSLAFVAWAIASRRLSTGMRRATMVATILLSCGAFGLIRTGGFTGDFDNDLAWRWSETAEQRLLASAGEDPVPPTPAPTALEIAQPVSPEPAGNEATALPSAPDAEAGPTTTTPVEPGARERVSSTLAPVAARPGVAWPGFRGPARDGIVRHIRIATDWTASPPVELWRRPIGPGWSSFAVAGDLIYTQEQRGDDEVVSAYSLTSGEPVWRHRDGARFWESNGGAGPRATPTISGGRVYTFGATGILNALDAGSGAVVWSRNAASDTNSAVSTWGFSSSPLLIDDIVMVAVAGQLAAYDLATGHPRWVGPDGGEGYSSPHLATIDGVEQVLLISAGGATSVDPADGRLLWEHEWRVDARIVQPALTADGDVLLSAEGMLGMRRVSIAFGSGAWTTEERWTTNRLKPYFSDFVVHEGHAYGFDGSILAAIDVETGERMWKGGRYGQGQLVLLPDQDVLLVLSEEGELALVQAIPDGFSELARFRALEGKTWNHPVLAGDVLLVRNGEEMAAFRLARADD